jgi:hypothetical protein
MKDRKRKFDSESLKVKVGKWGVFLSVFPYFIHSITHRCTYVHQSVVSLYPSIPYISVRVPVGSRPGSKFRVL